MARAALRQTVEGTRVYEVQERTIVIGTRLPYGGVRFDDACERKVEVVHRDLDDTSDFRAMRSLMQGNRGVL